MQEKKAQKDLAYDDLLQQCQNLERQVGEQVQKLKELEKEKDHYCGLYKMLHLLIDNTPDLLWAKDLEKRHLLVNKANCEQLLLCDSPEEAVGKRHEYFAAKQVEMGSEYTFGSICEDSDDVVKRNRKPQRFFEDGLIGGDYLALDVHKAPFYNEEGEMVGIVGCARNVTEEVKARKEKESLQKQLEHSRKMEAIGNVAGGIAHDFNNILTSIIGYTELAQDVAGKNTELYEYLLEILRAGVRARELVRRVLTFARKSSEESKLIQLDQVITEVIKLMRSTLPSTIEIQYRMDIDAQMMGNEVQIHQILMNLLTNAGQAMAAEGGVLSVTVEEMDVAKTEGTPLSLSEGVYARITVADTGPGISQEIIDSIFEPYFTTKESDEGTGIGLANVYRIVEGYGGKVTVHSKEGEGAVFQVYLPVITGTVEQKDDSAVLIEKGCEQHILFVDDEEVITRMASRLFPRIGYTVSTEISSVKALERFKKNPDAYDLVITDLTMPEMTGDVLAKKMLGIRPDLPVILCTGFSKHISEEDAMKMGIKAYLYKPLVKDEMARIIREILAD